MFFFPFRDDNPTSMKPYISWLLITLCSLTFFYQMGLNQIDFNNFVRSFGITPVKLINNVDNQWFTIISSMFVHGNLSHLIGNMVYLWIFGDNIEDSFGKVRFIIFYLLCGFAAVFAQILYDPNSPIPMIGASGAIAGVLGAYLLLFPRANVRCLIFIIIFIQMIRVPAFLVLGIWILGQFFSLPGSLDSSGGTAYFAHIGGFLAGMILIPFFKKTNVRLLQEKNSIAWVAESGFNFRQDENKIKNDDLLGKFIEESEEEVRKRK